MPGIEQLSFFDDPEPDEPAETDLVFDEPELQLDKNLPIGQALELYVRWMRLSNSSRYTIKAFKSDVGLLARWAGMGTPISEFSTEQLNTFLRWMLHERDKPCSPKTYARRVTALKNFFGWLTDEGALPRDPSGALIQRTVSSPLPDTLTPEEVSRVLDVTQALRRPPEPDARPHLLVALLLQTGIKKGECMALRRPDVQETGINAPGIWIRYNKPQMRYKERLIPVAESWLLVLREYLHQRKPQGPIFDCTARNLEYVLRDVADQAGVERSKVSFETLRWTCALRDFRAGMEPESLRIKLGLSHVSWRETSRRLEKLAENAV